MEGPPVGSLVLSGAGYGPGNAGPSRPTRPADAAMHPAMVPKITSVDALIKELRKAIHAMFCTVDQSIPSSSPKKSPPLHEYMALDELEKCIAWKLEEKMPRSANLVSEAFRFFTNAEVITFADFHHHLGMLQIHLSPPKCRELFVRFDKDRDGGESGQESRLSTKQLVAMVRERMDQLSEETDRFQQAFMLFGKPSGISLHDLNVAMRRLGMKMSEKQLQDLFVTFDFDKTGDLDVNKFVQGVMLDDYSTSFWLSVKDRQKVDDSRRKLYSMAVQR
uniref:EF-hand domain-containing protein n=1 Tax=Phytophthora ramorum TaxID=164328 RepID=H3HDG1_PHYRM